MFEQFMTISTLVVAFMHQPQIPFHQGHYTRDQITAPGMFIVAHRGGAMEGWENSMSAIHHSHNVGVHGIHIDLQRTSDGVFVLSHDDHLERTTGQEEHISNIEYSQIHHYKDHIDNGFGEIFHHENTEQEKPPRFEDVLDFFDNTSETIFITDHTTHWTHTFEILKMIKSHGILNRVVFNTSQDWSQIRSKFGHSISSWSGHEHMEGTYNEFFGGQFFEHPEEFQWDVFHTTWNFHTVQQSPWYEENDFTFSDSKDFQNFVHSLEERKSSVQLMNHSFGRHGIPTTYWNANSEQDWWKAMEIGAHATFTDKPAEAWIFNHNASRGEWQSWSSWNKWDGDWSQRNPHMSHHH